MDILRMNGNDEITIIISCEFTKCNNSDLYEEGSASSNEDIYEGQVIGENSRAGDLCVNVTKTKKLTNMRASGSDDKVRLAPPKVFSLEECLEYIQSDEYVEVTPKNLRIRKILLKETDRKRSGKA